MTKLEMVTHPIIKPILANKILKEEIKKSIARIRTCPLCYHGFWSGGECPNHKRVPLRVLSIIEHVTIVLYNPNKSIVKKKKVMKRKDRECEVCGANSKGKMCCSDICQIRLGSCWIEKGGVKAYISLEEAQKRVDGIIERRRLRENEKKGN